MDLERAINTRIDEVEGERAALELVDSYQPLDVDLDDSVAPGYIVPYDNGLQSRYANMRRQSTLDADYLRSVRTRRAREERRARVGAYRNLPPWAQETLDEDVPSWYNRASLAASAGPNNGFGVAVPEQLPDLGDLAPPSTPADSGDVVVRGEVLNEAKKRVRYKKHWIEYSTPEELQRKKDQIDGKSKGTRGVVPQDLGLGGVTQAPSTTADVWTEEKQKRLNDILNGVIRY